jgi:hypothetical protein
MPSSHSRILSAWQDGWTRVMTAPAVAAGVFMLTLALTIPLAAMLRDQIATHLGNSLMADRAADGVNWDWWQEFTAQASGLGTTFTPSVIGFAATLKNVSGLLDGERPIAPIAAVTALFLIGWAFLTGGIIDRYARQRATRAHGFFGACGVYFFRFLRLGAAVGIVYWWLFAYVHPWFFKDLFVLATRNLAVERTAFLWRVVFYVLFGALLLVMNVVTDYAKIRLVVDDRRSALGALGAAWRFIRHHPGHVTGLYALNSLVFVMALLVWALVAPGAGGAGISMWLGLIVSELYVIARLLMKLQFVASQTALFQSHLAHARYAAAPEPVWPDSAAAEAIARGSG